MVGTARLWRTDGLENVFAIWWWSPSFRRGPPCVDRARSVVPTERRNVELAVVLRLDKLVGHEERVGETIGIGHAHEGDFALTGHIHKRVRISEGDPFWVRVGRVVACLARYLLKWRKRARIVGP